MMVTSRHGCMYALFFTFKARIHKSPLKRCPKAYFGSGHHAPARISTYEILIYKALGCVQCLTQLTFYILYTAVDFIIFVQNNFQTFPPPTTKIKNDFVKK